MGAYSTGTVAVTNGSAVVTGTGTLFVTAGVAAGMPFSVVGSGVVYNIASVDSETQITLTGNYGGSTDSGLSYIIGLDSTTNLGFPLPNPNDLDATTLVKEALNQVDAAMSLRDGFVKRTFFTASDTWTPDPATRWIEVIVIGGGGGGGSNSTGPAGSGGGGGGGGFSIKRITSFGATETVTIGAGGAGATVVATTGASGGTSSFGAHCSASGGAGGTRADYGGAGGAGGNGSGGDFNVRSGPGVGGSTSGYWYASGGGPAWLGGGGANIYQGAHGSGGSGTPDIATNAAKNGGDGVVIVTEYK